MYEVTRRPIDKTIHTIRTYRYLKNQKYYFLTRIFVLENTHIYHTHNYLHNSLIAIPKRRNIPSSSVFPCFENTSPAYAYLVDFRNEFNVAMIHLTAGSHSATASSRDGHAEDDVLFVSSKGSEASKLWINYLSACFEQISRQQGRPPYRWGLFYTRDSSTARAHL